MRPPWCVICRLSLDDIPADADIYEHFAVVRFADYNPPPIDLDLVGGPWPGSAWFCVRHAVPARERIAMPIAAACEEIKAIVARDRD